MTSLKKKRVFWFVLVFAVNQMVAQTTTKVLKVIDIQEFSEAYLIKCLDEKKDTILVASEKQSVVGTCYLKIEKDKCYAISLIDRPIINRNSLVVRVKNTVFWKKGDRIDQIPFFATNLKDSYIKRSY